MNSLRWRLLIGLTALVAAVIALAGYVTYQRTLETTGTLLDYQLGQMALSLRDQGSVRLPTEGDPDYAIQIWDASGVQVYSSRRDKPLFARAKWI